jgi:hypothetical protein
MIREIVGDPRHADRAAIHPSHDDVERLRAAGEPYVWRIDSELLVRRFPVTGKSEPAVVPHDGRPTGELVMRVLQDQLQSKDEQIRTLERQLDRKDEQIANMNERQRETNVLMRELQQRLALAPPLRTTPDTLAAELSSETTRRTGILRRIFGR